MKQMNVKAVIVVLAMKFVLSEFVGRLVFASLISSGLMVFLTPAIQTPVGMLNLYAVMFLGADLFINLCAGYLVAFWAPARQLQHGIILGFLCLGFSYLSSPISNEVGSPLWSHFTRYLVVPEICLGSWLLVKRQMGKVPKHDDNQIAPIASPSEQ